jgi:hypothetical protein
MSAKEDLLVAAAREYTALHDALDGLNEDEAAVPFAGEWSVHDVIAHLVGWHQEMRPALERLARNERPFPEGVRYDDLDAWNARFVAARRGVSTADLLLDLDRSHAEFLKAAGEVPERRFTPGRTVYRIVDLNTAHHYREHAAQIRDWRASRGV